VIVQFNKISVKIINRFIHLYHHDFMQLKSKTESSFKNEVLPKELQLNSFNPKIMLLHERTLNSLNCLYYKPTVHVLVESFRAYSYLFSSGMDLAC